MHVLVLKTVTLNSNYGPSKIAIKIPKATALARVVCYIPLQRRAQSWVAWLWVCWLVHVPLGGVPPHTPPLSPPYEHHPRVVCTCQYLLSHYILQDYINIQQMLYGSFLWSPTHLQNIPMPTHNISSWPIGHAPLVRVLIGLTEHLP